MQKSLTSNALGHYDCTCPCECKHCTCEPTHRFFSVDLHTTSSIADTGVAFSLRQVTMPQEPRLVMQVLSWQMLLVGRNYNYSTWLARVKQHHLKRMQEAMRAFV